MKELKNYTLVELLKQTAAGHILKTDEESICIYQDIIGHSSVGELEKLSNLPEFKETFYWIYGLSYGTVAAIKFYLSNSEEIKQINTELDNFKEKTERLKNQLGETEKRLSEEKKINLDYEEEIKNFQDSIYIKEQEIIKLKARLYDLMQ